MKSVLILPLCILLTSCTGNVREPIVILPSKPLLAACTISPPPDLTGNDARDKVLLSSAWTKQTTNLGDCNKKIEMLQLWRDTQIKRYGLDDQ